jgi:hydrogenase assembly chaperone HypC/HupF
MCFTIPGLIISINKDIALVSFDNIKKECKLLIDASVGDYVIVQSNYALKKVEKFEALKIFEVIK